MLRGQCPQSAPGVVSFRQLCRAGAQPDRRPGRFRAEGQSTRKAARPAPPRRSRQGPSLHGWGSGPQVTHRPLPRVAPAGDDDTGPRQVSSAKGPVPPAGLALGLGAPGPPWPRPLQPRPRPRPCAHARPGRGGAGRGAHARSCQSGGAAAEGWRAVSAGTADPSVLRIPPLAVPHPTPRATPGHTAIPPAGRAGAARGPARGSAAPRCRRRPCPKPTVRGAAGGPRPGHLLLGFPGPCPRARPCACSGESDLGVREAGPAGSVCGFVPARPGAGWASPASGVWPRTPLELRWPGARVVCRPWAPWGRACV